MLSAKSYFSNHTLQFIDADNLLKKFKSFIRWDSALKVIDIGCGLGDITHDLLFPLIHSNAQLRGIDISESMIDVANYQYANGNLSFETMDLAGDEIVRKYRSYFDLAVSFYCINWIPDQERTIKNMYSILKPKSQILLLIVVDSPIYSIFEQTAKSPKWAKYVKNYREVISAYRNCTDPASIFENSMRKVGFHVDECYFSTKSYQFSSKKLYNEWIKGVHPFRKNIPEHLLEEYDEECEKVYLHENSLCVWDESTNEVTINYTVLTCLAHN